MTAIREIARKKHISRRTVKRLIECGWSDARIEREAVPGKRYNTKSVRARKTNKEKVKELIKRIEQSHKKTIDELLSRLFTQFSFIEVAEALSISRYELKKIILLEAKQYRDKIFIYTKEGKFIKL